MNEETVKEYKSDGESLEIITQHVNSIYNTLIKKGIITGEEALEIIKATNERINSGGKRRWK